MALKVKASNRAARPPFQTAESVLPAHFPNPPRHLCHTGLQVIPASNEVSFPNTSAYSKKTSLERFPYTNLFFHGIAG
jgi:hypothetical protein